MLNKIDSLHFVDIFFKQIKTEDKIEKLLQSEVKIKLEVWIPKQSKLNWTLKIIKMFFLRNQNFEKFLINERKHKPEKLKLIELT